LLKEISVYHRCMNSISEPRRNNVVTQSGGHLNSSNSVPQFKGRGNTKWGGEHCSAQNREEDGVANEGPQRPRFYNSKSKRGNNKSEENTNRYKYQSKGQTHRGSSFKRSHHQGGEGSLTWRPKIYQPESSVFKYDSASATPEKGTDRETQDVAKGMVDRVLLITYFILPELCTISSDVFSLSLPLLTSIPSQSPSINENRTKM